MDFHENPKKPETTLHHSAWHNIRLQYKRAFAKYIWWNRLMDGTENNEKDGTCKLRKRGFDIKCTIFVGLDRYVQRIVSLPAEQN